MQTVVGIAGRIGAGKDVMAQRLVDRWGFHLIRFSQALKDEVLRNLPRTLEAIKVVTNRPESVYEMVHFTKPAIVRELLQEYGTEIRRGDEPDYWVDRWLETVGGLKALLANKVRIVAPDMRFENEARAVKALGGWTVHVARPMPTMADAEEGLHESERGLWNYLFDARFANVSTIEAFQEQVDRWAEDNLCF